MSINLSDVTNRTLPAVLSAWAQATPNNIFLMDGELRETFAQTHEKVLKLSNGLAANGIKAGDRVAILMGSRADYVRLVLAINRLGAVWVPINPDYKGDWLSDAVNDSLAAALVVEEPYVGQVADIEGALTPLTFITLGNAGRLASKAVDYDSLSAASHPDVPAAPITWGDTAAILWTSGTTGRPKGVMQSHNAWIHIAEKGNANWETREGDIGYNCLPLYNSAAWCATIFRCLVAGIPVAIDPHFSVTKFWERIRYYGATQTMSLGAMHMFLYNAPPKPDDRDNPLRAAGLIPIPEHLIEPFCKRFGIDLVVQGYGQSEVMSLLTRRTAPGDPIKPNSLGVAWPDVDIKLVDENGQEVPTGTPGEFAIRPKTPNLIFNGYFNNEEATANAWIDGWYRTGDLGRQDDEGDWFFVDRKKDYIRYKGRSIPSFMIEHVAMKHPAVAECAAFGIPSAELESEYEIKLDVVLRTGESIAPEDLARFINENAPYFVVPRFIEVREKLPYTPTNKVEKYKLREAGVGPATWDREAVNFEVRR